MTLVVADYTQARADPRDPDLLRHQDRHVTEDCEEEYLTASVGHDKAAAMETEGLSIGNES